MPTSAQILGPVVGLNLWTLFVEGWMYSNRIPAVNDKSKFKMELTPDMTLEKFNSALPPKVRWKGDNFNNLLQQPLQFYAIMLVLAQLGTGTQTDVNLAWGYVGIRVVHSLWQCLSNRLMARFGLFVSSSAVLAVITVRTAARVFV
ncbi:hypothetical protein TWF694_001710 [Orbilia ellipsospora]|uniref:MAPEG family protein n=1 Tax=Orbilia ellipsospora TaxID=2528407 RepID=A0AAV9X4U0_9PEZI